MCRDEIGIPLNLHSFEYFYILRNCQLIAKILRRCLRWGENNIIVQDDSRKDGRYAGKIGELAVPL